MNVEVHIRDIISEKTEGSGGTVNRMSDSAEIVARRGSINFEKVGTIGRLLLIIATLRRVKGELTNETIHHDTEIEAYQFQPEL